MSEYKYRVLRLWVVLLSLNSLIFACRYNEEITYAKDIAPIITKNCIQCHSTDGAAPFTLNTYHSVRKRAKMIVFVTSSGYMPPWPADRQYSHFINEKGLSKEEIECIGKWYKQGCPIGDTSQLQTLLASEMSSTLGKPDLIVRLQAIEISNNNRDKFYTLKIPITLPEQRYVKAIEFVPGQSKLVHHVNGHYLWYSDAANPEIGNKRADIESEQYASEFKALSLLNPDGSIPFRVHSAFNYLPGAFGVQYPNGIGGFIIGKKGAFVANDIHYGPSRKTVTDSSKLYIYFSDKAPERVTSEFMMGTNGVSAIDPPLQVKANTVSKHVSRLAIYSDISILTVNPHMHLIGKSFKAYALKPNGDTVQLISIPKWQFRWQYFYTYQYPQRIPKGSVIIVEAEFDNTAKNPNNPFNPPKDIGERMDKGGASMRTTDEMLQFIVTYMPYKKGDENIDLSKP